MKTDQLFIISCVGMRPLAVANPIATLVDHWGSAVREVHLLPTDQTRNHGETVARWLEKRFPSLTVRRETFHKDPSWLAAILRDAETVIFHADPGMNWQIAWLGMNLPPGRTLVSYADFDKLYLWPLGEDISSPQTVLDLQDVGLEDYGYLSGDRYFVVVDSVPYYGACSDLRGMLCHKKGGVFFQLVPKEEDGGPLLPQPLLNVVHSRLLWVRERRGMLYLLFDLRRERRFCYQEGCPYRPPPPEKKEWVKLEHRDLFRLILALFPPLSYSLSVITDDEGTGKRCQVEGIPCLKSRDLKTIQNWIEGINLPSPKAVLPWEPTPTCVPQPFRPSELNLFCAVGNNPDPTIQAVRSHQPCSAGLFYDKNAPRLRDQALRLQALLAKEYPDRNFPLLPTDHLGRGIVRQMKNLPGKYMVNVTPGTKAQGLALAVVAKGAGMPVYSIDKGRVVNLLDDRDYRTVRPTTLRDLLEAMPLTVEERPPDDANLAPLWRLLLKHLAAGRLALAPEAPEDLEKIILVPEGSKAFTVTPDGSGYVYGGRPNQPVEIPRAYAEGKPKGFWWEETAAQAIADALPQSTVKRGLKWQRSQGGGLPGYEIHTEMDIAFDYDGHIVAVSCKAGKVDFMTETFLIRAEATGRFGRFALPCVAVPYMKQGKKRLPEDLMIKDALILTPVILADAGRLKSALDHFIACRQTTLR
ncbi:MAG: hypothetical protein N2Z74_00060 [Syntrophales bacterium]|nr:hypothetical protein [Syntrophales bacterium]